MTTPGPSRNLWNIRRKGAASKPQFIMGEAPFEFRTVTGNWDTEMVPITSVGTDVPHTVNLTTSPTPKPHHVGAAPKSRPWMKEADKICVNRSDRLGGTVVVTEHQVPPPPAGTMNTRIWSSPTPPPPDTEESDENVVCSVDSTSETNSNASNDTGSDTSCNASSDTSSDTSSDASSDTSSDTGSDAEYPRYHFTSDTIVNILIMIMVANHLMHFLSTSTLVLLERTAATVLIGYTIHFGVHMTGHTRTYTDGSAKAHVVTLIVSTLCRLHISQ